MRRSRRVGRSGATGECESAVGLGAICILFRGLCNPCTAAGSHGETSPPSRPRRRVADAQRVSDCNLRSLQRHARWHWLPSHRRAHPDSRRMRISRPELVTWHNRSTTWRRPRDTPIASSGSACKRSPLPNGIDQRKLRIRPRRHELYDFALSPRASSADHQRAPP